MVSAWVVLIFCVLGLPFHSGDQDISPSIWWTIEISASVSGNYRVDKNPLVLTGSYRFLFNCQGSIERDNGDYILYQGEKHIAGLNWIEERGGESFDLSQTMHPGFKLNYVIRREQVICLDFETFPVTAGGKYLPIKIFLPCSDENGQINSRNRYNDRMVQGSNVIGVLEDRLYNVNRISEIFRWQWEKTERDGRQNHSVEFELKITRKNK